MDTTQIIVPTIVGAILTFLIPLIIRQSWPRWLRFTVAILITLATTALVLVAFLKPDTWQAIAAVLAIAVATGQVVYGALKPTGLFDWLERTEPAKDET